MSSTRRTPSPGPGPGAGQPALIPFATHAVEVDLGDADLDADHDAETSDATDATATDTDTGAGAGADGDGDGGVDVVFQQPLMACVDGPMRGQWFTTTDWTTRRDAAAAMLEAGQQRTASLDYTPTGQHIRHPHARSHGTAVTGHAWRWQPTTDTTDERATVGNESAGTAAPVGRNEAAGDGTGGAGPGAGPAIDAPTLETGPVTGSGAGPEAVLRVLVTGSRGWVSTSAVHAALDGVRARLVPGQRLTVVHGANPRGADAMADAWVARRHAAGDTAVDVERHHADWDTHGRRAGMLRNQQMVDAGADTCLAFIRDASPGATHCAQAATTAGIPTHRHTTSTASSTPSPPGDDASAARDGDTPTATPDEDGWGL